MGKKNFECRHYSQKLSSSSSSWQYKTYRITEPTRQSSIHWEEKNEKSQKYDHKSSKQQFESMKWI